MLKNLKSACCGSLIWYCFAVALPFETALGRVHQTAKLSPSEEQSDTFINEDQKANGIQLRAIVFSHILRETHSNLSPETMSDPEISFLRYMLLHNEAAVRMSAFPAEFGASDEVRTMIERIVRDANRLNSRIGYLLLDKREN